ncbi:MAG: phosphonoacetaldehyde hydrolase [Roseovarius sp.]|nr:phosphonoacetaldehyde hydrolase [Roseovarius sp.]MBK43974.1 phosphonoacetaldehyde hydrolase [Roseovarius sp.]
MTRFEAVIFDWAGTLIDFGSFAPMGAFVEAFAQFGVSVSIADARGPMGAPKREHIRAMMALPHVAEAWRAAQGSEPDEAAIDRLYEVFVPLNEEVVARYATLVPGASETLGWLAGQGIRVGTTTGYTRSIMARVLPVVAGQGFAPEVCVCADDVPKGRPGPWQMYRAFAEMTLLPGPHIVKVDDTPPGIMEGRATGCTVVGVALSGNIAGRTPEEIAALSDAGREAIRARAGAELRAAGADHVIDSIADLPALLTRLDAEG